MPNGNDFRKAFSSAKKKGQKTFTYKGKRYTTQTAAEKAKKMTSSQLKSARNKSYEKAKSSGFKSKSRNEISESYTREEQYRMGDKLKKMGLDPTKYSDRMKGNFKGSAYAKKRPKKRR
jgi:hypothetical protein